MSLPSLAHGPAPWTSFQLPPHRQQRKYGFIPTTLPSCTFWCQVSCFQCVLWDEHIKLFTLWMRNSALIQDENVVIHVLVYKMHPEVETVIGLPWAPLDWTVYLWGHTREVHPVLHCRVWWKIWRNFFCGMSWPVVFHFHMDGQEHLHHIHSALRVNYLKSLPQLVLIALAYHLPPMGRCEVYSWTWGHIYINLTKWSGVWYYNIINNMKVHVIIYIVL